MMVPATTFRLFVKSVQMQSCAIIIISENPRVALIIDDKTNIILTNELKMRRK
jgi:hypothetical protein